MSRFETRMAALAYGEPRVEVRFRARAPLWLLRARYRFWGRAWSSVVRRARALERRHQRALNEYAYRADPESYR